MNRLASALAHDLTSSSPLEDRFCTLLQVFCKTLQSEGLEITPYRESSLVRFRSLSPDQQNQKFRDFQRYFEVFAEAVSEGVGLKDSAGLLKKVLTRGGLSTCPEMYQHLENEDVIEAYSSDFTQLFRNLRFLEICSYPLLDLYLYEWFELFRRPQNVTDILVSLAHEILAQTKPSLVKCEVPDHFLEEVFSEQKHRFHIKQMNVPRKWLKLKNLVMLLPQV